MEEYQQLDPPQRMTLRQVFYRLVSLQVTENNYDSYKALGRHLVKARKEGMIPWGWVEDRTRRPRRVSMWADLDGYLDTVAISYRRDVWADQSRRVEVWLEKETLSPVFDTILEPYGITLNVPHGFDGWSSIHEAAGRLDADDVILFFSDFDPSGQDMHRSLRDRLAWFGCEPEIRKVALTLEDVERYQLPQNRCKATDKRSRGHIERYGNISVELDALPPAELIRMAQQSICSVMDLDALARTKKREAKETTKLQTLMGRQP